VTEIRTYTWHSGSSQHCNNRLVHFVLSMSIQTLESFITPEVTQTLFLERSWLHCHVIVLLLGVRVDYAIPSQRSRRVLIKLRTALACHWPGVIPYPKELIVECRVSRHDRTMIGVTGGYEPPGRSPLSLGSQASSSSPALPWRDRALDRAHHRGGRREVWILPLNAPGCHGLVLASAHGKARILSSSPSSQASDSESQAERPWQARPLPRPGHLPITLPARLNKKTGLKSGPSGCRHCEDPSWSGLPAQVQRAYNLKVDASRRAEKRCSLRVQVGPR
jgi:hypothetical protein